MDRKLNVQQILLLAVGLLFACCIVPCFCADSAPPNSQEENGCWVCGVRGVPFPDEDINRYVGHVVDPGVIAEIGRIVEERYPGHYISFSFKMIENETNWIPLGDNNREVHFNKILLTSCLDHGLIDSGGKVLEPPVAELTNSKDGAEQVEPLAGPFPYSEDLSPRSGKIHGYHYLAGLYEFESHTSWSPSGVDMDIGLWNHDTEVAVART